MRWLLPAVLVLCAILHAHALPTFITKFLLPENTDAQPVVTQKVQEYIQDLAQRQAIQLGNWTLQVAMQDVVP